MTKGIRLINKLMKLERKETFSDSRLNHWIEELKNISVMGNIRCPCITNLVWPSTCFCQEDYFKHRDNFSFRDYCWKKCPRSKIWQKLIKYTRFNLDRRFKVKTYLVVQLKTLLEIFLSCLT